MSRVSPACVSPQTSQVKATLRGGRRAREVLLPDLRDRRRREMDEEHRRRRPRRPLQVQPGVLEQPVALAQVARRAGGDDVLPDRLAALRARDDVVERQPARARCRSRRSASRRGRRARGARSCAGSHAAPGRTGRAGSRAARRRCRSRSGGPWAGSRAPPPSPSRRARAHAAPNRRSAARNLHSGREPVATRTEEYQRAPFLGVIWPWRARPPPAPRGRARSARGPGRAP